MVQITPTSFLLHKRRCQSAYSKGGSISLNLTKTNENEIPDKSDNTSEVKVSENLNENF